jgi:tRNA(Ile)-lysidine synthase
LLGVRRAEIEAYLQGVHQDWREDASNLDEKHTRNRIRHELLPKLTQEWNPALAKLLAELAETARAEEEYWNGLAQKLLPALYSQTNDAIRVETLLAHPVAVQRRLLRAAAEKAGLRLDFEHVEALRRLAGSRATQQPKTQMVEGGAGELQKIAGQAELRLVRGRPSIGERRIP